MGTVPKPEIKRDKNLIEDYLTLNEDGNWKYTLAQLGWKYRRTVAGEEIPLTTTRIYQILDKHGVEKNRVIKSKSK